MVKKMMDYMNTYGGQENPGYKAPKGNAGSEGKGEFSSKKNPLAVPKKGSDIGTAYGNSDRMKIMKLQEEQSKKESLRGQPC